jgi:hypothetical protein
MKNPKLVCHTPGCPKFNVLGREIDPENCLHKKYVAKKYVAKTPSDYLSCGHSQFDTRDTCATCLKFVVDKLNAQILAVPKQTRSVLDLGRSSGSTRVVCENCSSGDNLFKYSYFGASQILCNSCADLPIGDLQCKSIYFAMHSRNGVTDIQAAPL